MFVRPSAYALALIVFAPLAALGCGESPSRAGSDTPYVAAGARMDPPPPLDDAFIEGYDEVEPGVFALESDIPAFDGMRVRQALDGTTHSFTIETSGDVYEIVMDPVTETSEIILNGSTISFSDSTGLETYDGFEEAKVTEVLRISGTFFERLQRDGVVDLSDSPRRPVFEDIGCVFTAPTPLPLASGLNAGIGRHIVAYAAALHAMALQTQQSHWYRGNGTAATRT